MWMWQSVIIVYELRSNLRDRNHKQVPCPRGPLAGAGHCDGLFYGPLSTAPNGFLLDTCFPQGDPIRCAIQSSCSVIACMPHWCLGLPGEGPMNPLTKLNKQYIGGVWREGRSSNVLSDKNPYSGSVIADFRLASLADLDEAYRSAASARRFGLK